jgi:hypothetical protein
LDSWRLITWAIPVSITGSKVSLHCKEVGTNYPSFGPKVLPALAVQTESMKFGPEGGSVPLVGGSCCEKASKSRLVEVQTGKSSPTLLDPPALNICPCLDSNDILPCHQSWNHDQIY